MSGGAPAIDSSGNLFLSTGNGNFSDTSNVLPPLALSNDFGESFLHLDPTTLAVKDFYTPSQYLAWSNADLDIASAGVTVLPDGSGPSGHPNVFIGLDKQGHLWMIDRSNMSGFNSSADNTVQYLSLPAPNVCGDCAYGTPAYWNGKIYLGLENNSLMIYTLSKGLIPSISSTAVPYSITAETYGYPSPTPMISASPGGNAVVWVLDTRSAAQGGSQPSPAGPAILRAYDATSLATRLYSSDVLAADIPGNAIKFTVPVVANGHVYVGGDGVLTVYGLAP